MKEKNEHFELVRRVIKSWPKWKREIGFPPLKNPQMDYQSNNEKEEDKTG